TTYATYFSLGTTWKDPRRIVLGCVSQSRWPVCPANRTSQALLKSCQRISPGLVRVPNTLDSLTRRGPFLGSPIPTKRIDKHFPCGLPSVPVNSPRTGIHSFPTDRE